MAERRRLPAPEEVHAALMDALTDYLKISTGLESPLATDYVLTVAGIDLSAADGQVYYATAYTGPPHARLGLVELLSADISEDVFPES